MPGKSPIMSFCKKGRAAWLAINTYSDRQLIGVDVFGILFLVVILPHFLLLFQPHTPAILAAWCVSMSNFVRYFMALGLMLLDVRSRAPVMHVACHFLRV